MQTMILGIRIILLIFSAILTLSSAAYAASGKFGGIIGWPLIPIHVSLLPDGRVLSYGTDGSGNQTGQFIYDIWDPALGVNDNSHWVLPNTTGTDIFCSSQTVLAASGQELITGGDNPLPDGTRGNGNNQTNIFDPTSDTLNPNGQMAFTRWYDSLVALPNEQAVVLGGRSNLAQTVFGITPEIYDPTAKTWTQLPGATSDDAFGSNGSDWFYPRSYVIPGGDIAVLSNYGAVFDLNINGAGSINQFPISIPSGSTDYVTVSYAPGHVLSTRGGTEVITIDFTTNPPTVADTSPIDQPRSFASGSILPDGQVLLTGGSANFNDLNTAAYQALIWNPATGQWSPDAYAAVARMYHSNSLLLPDASVLVAGGGAPGPLTNLNAEIYYPPYLFNDDGSFARRPTVIQSQSSADATVGGVVWTYSDIPISRLTLVRIGSATHANNSDQRFIEILPLMHSADFYGNDIPWGWLPNDSSVVVPGYYAMFAFSDSGVPSLGQIIHITP